jgi:hypothetical protein
MTTIFVSYRRDDSTYAAGALTDKLKESFGHEAIFFDIDTIPLGVDFRDYITTAVGRCLVLLVVIGDAWVDVHNSDGKRRLDDVADYVRIEIESAVTRGIPIIPVLVGQATMPSADELPASIQPIENQGGRKPKGVSHLNNKTPATISHRAIKCQL